jgi:hypothetical protein
MLSLRKKQDLLFGKPSTNANPKAPIQMKSSLNGSQVVQTSLDAFQGSNLKVEL